MGVVAVIGRVEVEPDGVHQTPDVEHVAGVERDAGAGLGLITLVVGVEKLGPLTERHRGGLVVVERHDEDAVIIARGVVELVERVSELSENGRADDGALVVHHHEHHGGLAVEVVAKHDGLAVVIGERRVQRDRVAELFGDLDAVEFHDLVTIQEPLRCRAGRENPHARDGEQRGQQSGGRSVVHGSRWARFSCWMRTPRSPARWRCGRRVPSR